MKSKFAFLILPLIGISLLFPFNLMAEGSDVEDSPREEARLGEEGSSDGEEDLPPPPSHPPRGHRRWHSEAMPPSHRPLLSTHSSLSGEGSPNGLRHRSPGRGSSRIARVPVRVNNDVVLEIASDEEDAVDPTTQRGGDPRVLQELRRIKRGEGCTHICNGFFCCAVCGLYSFAAMVFLLWVVYPNQCG